MGSYSDSYANAIAFLESPTDDSTSLSDARTLYTDLKAKNQANASVLSNAVNDFTHATNTNLQKNLILDAQNEFSKFNFLEKYLFLIIKIILFIILGTLLFIRTYKNINVNFDDIASRARQMTQSSDTNSSTKI